MNIKHILWIVALGLVGWIGCSDDETLIPSDTLVPQIELPQGNHEYDTKIVDFFERDYIFFISLSRGMFILPEILRGVKCITIQS